MNQVVTAEREFALLIGQAESPPQVALAYLRLMLNYLYGLEVIEADKMTEVASKVNEHGEALRCLFLVQDKEINSRNAISVLSRRGEMPLFVLMPDALAEQHRDMLDMPNVCLCTYSGAVGKSDPSLQSLVADSFEEEGIVQLPLALEGLPQDLIEKRVAERLKHIDALPTLPQLVLRLSQLLADPKTTAEDLEELVVSDAAIVHRLLQVVSSTAISGTRDSDTWTLREAVVRLGLKQVGAIAQQIKLVNGMVRPERSKFDLQRFWMHSVATAYIADQLYERKLLNLQAEIEFDRYWIAGLLHDIGKLVLGFFAWEYFRDLVDSMGRRNNTFRREEERLGHFLTHEYIGRMMLINARAPREVVEVAATHNTPPGQPRPLLSLVHMANNLATELGFGYLPEQAVRYNTSVLMALGIRKKDVEGIKNELGEEVAADIEDIYVRCIEG